ncbi:BA14K family protein [Gellertiella hungarica]|uniref:Lectin-like protein BA14k n=1 Tax=Gellertiella hungarica TaxID=1572859 RepID=A0A7W6NKH8_9HYPH|nr:BA14K family protein [Gellertiella hungarica]MBB4065450.1 hypothetical protein [Gellertiella hungarica]
MMTMKPARWAFLSLLLLAQAIPASAGPLPVPKSTADIAGPLMAVTHWRGFYRVRGVYFYNGYRGIVVARPGYRFYRGYWFPPAAFAAGVAVGRSTLPDVPGRLNAHMRWCFEHYRSYRASDNSYQPHIGPRQQCRSPFA